MCWIYRRSRRIEDHHRIGVAATTPNIYFYPGSSTQSAAAAVNPPTASATATVTAATSSIAFTAAATSTPVVPSGVISFAAHPTSSPSTATGSVTRVMGQQQSMGGGGPSSSPSSSYNPVAAAAGVISFASPPQAHRPSPPPIPPRPSSAVAHAAVSSSSSSVTSPQPNPAPYQQSPAAAPRSTLAGAGATIGGTSSPSTVGTSSPAVPPSISVNNQPAPPPAIPPGQSDDPNVIFERLRVLRTTLFGQLWLAKYKATGQLCAIKRSEKERMLNTRSREDPRAECRMLRIVRGHRNVVNLLGEYECAKYHWIVYELVEGGDFFGLVERNGKLSDITARVYFKQMVQGVLFMHKAGLAHLDLKPENLLITRDHTDIKICDFGMSRELKEARPLASAPTSPIRYFQGPTGTKLYMAPEVFAGRPFVPALADCYSLGVVLYVMLTGAPPYELPAESDLRFQYIFNGRLVELLKHFKYFDAMHADAIDLLSRMLCTYLNRLSLEQVLQHPWLAGVDAEMKKPPSSLAAANIGAAATTITPSSSTAATPGVAVATAAGSAVVNAAAVAATSAAGTGSVKTR